MNETIIAALTQQITQLTQSNRASTKQLAQTWLNHGANSSTKPAQLAQIIYQALTLVPEALEVVSPSTLASQVLGISNTLPRNPNRVREIITHHCKTSFSLQDENALTLSGLLPAYLASTGKHEEAIHTIQLLLQKTATTHKLNTTQVTKILAYITEHKDIIFTGLIQTDELALNQYLSTRHTIAVPIALPDGTQTQIPLNDTRLLHILSDGAKAVLDRLHRIVSYQIRTSETANWLRTNTPSSLLHYQGQLDSRLNALEIERTTRTTSVTVAYECNHLPKIETIEIRHREQQTDQIAALPRRLVRIWQSLQLKQAGTTWLKRKKLNPPYNFEDLNPILIQEQKKLDHQVELQKKRTQLTNQRTQRNHITKKFKLSVEDETKFHASPYSSRLTAEQQLARFLFAPITKKNPTLKYTVVGIYASIVFPYAGNSIDYIYRGMESDRELITLLAAVKPEEREDTLQQHIYTKCDHNLTQVLNELQQAQLPKPGDAAVTEIIRYWKNALTDLTKLRRELRQRARLQIEAQAATSFPTLFGPLTNFVGGFAHARSQQRKIIAVLGPTNSGKTHRALEALTKAKSGTYLAPLRLLALEKQEEIIKLGIDATLLTGEERDLRSVDFVCSTIEMVDLTKRYEVAVIDEIQMIQDPDRGWAWTNAICGVNAATVYITGPAWMAPVVEDLAKQCGDLYELQLVTRKGSLKVLPNIQDWKSLPDRAAVISFSRKGVLAIADLYKTRGHEVSVLYGGLSPEVRRSQAQSFRDGTTKLLVATDVIGMGLNLPIDDLFFWETQKFDGEITRTLTPTEIQQIAGRAGRGINGSGRVGAFSKPELHDLEHGLAHQKPTVPTTYPVGPSVDHLEAIAKVLQNQKILPCLAFFHEKVAFKQTQFQSKLSESVWEIASIIDRTFPSMPLTQKWAWCCAPLDPADIPSRILFTGWLRSFRDKQLIAIDSIKQAMGQAERDEEFRGWQDEMHFAEVQVKLLSAYRWCAWRFPNQFTQLKQATEQRAELNDYVQKILSETENCNTQRKACRRCNRALPMDSEYDQCYSCYQQHRPPRRHSNSWDSEEDDFDEDF